ncbi:hypothetical protein [Lentilactobacillus farraginis]|uniref:Uncharacterized protein n=1 Tax=Lentilactobacillus farraginis DSM 18382 = JCM 14108 TaxID=1423743 RepID=X0PB60_9LACO|nr:hypothetical protein [Lentilactobacillus farraginis]GAF37149.1 hypothetical protein JCM14108_2164 [Lentilactobacillus farraginis DSM 18382 = JCM 14108]
MHFKRSISETLTFLWPLWLLLILIGIGKLLIDFFTTGQYHLVGNTLRLTKICFDSFVFLFIITIIDNLLKKRKQNQQK